MLCGICWRAPRPVQSAAAGYMALGALQNLCGLALWPPCRWAPHFPVAGVVSLSQCGGWGSGVGTSPGCKQAPSTSPSWAPGSCSSGARRAPPSSPACGSWAVLEGPSRPQRDIIRTNSGGYRRWGGSSCQGPAQDPASESPSTCPLAIALLLNPCWSPPPCGLLQSILYTAAARAF